MPHNSDPHRPLYHYSPNLWMNDVIPFVWNGELHQFYDYNPREAAWTNLSDWGHGVARDKIHWEELPPAFVPSQDADKEGCWTGCVVEHEGKFYAFYTGIPNFNPLKQVQCLALSNDLKTWIKYENNPIIADTPEGFGECFRDPQVWREGDEWVMIVGGELEGGKGGAAFLYTSRDLLHWEYSHVLCEGQTERTGYDYECPDFFELNGKHVFLSSRNKTWWQVGEYSNRRFEMQTWGPCDGEAFYAAKTTIDEQGRRLLLGWIREMRSEEETKAAGWGGVLSLPRVLSLGEDNSLRYEPLPELQKLRGHHQRFENLQIEANQTFTLPEVHGDALEIVVKFAPNPALNFGVRVRCSSDESEYSEVRFNRTEAKLGDVPLVLQNDESLTLHIFVDRSVIETFANNRACLTQRFYPQRNDCLGVRLFADGDVVVKSVDVWQIEP
jgi:beta-fructofuranosidase